ncbi:hypothetical protein M3215_22800 [Bacillus cytotoxicus]|uniref:Uncharacterized protein n=1 Tax=Bacillus cytotoxicus TaxID=580165 RepID=A0ACC6ACN3_9BACI|nr:hypothetical protein [Bacillus cytotoxicus]
MTVQDMLTKDILEEDIANDTIETVQLFQFMKHNAVPLTKRQQQGMLILNENGLHDLSLYVAGMKEEVLPLSEYHKTLEKLTLADRIKGNAKLSHLLKANANPSLSLSANNAKVVKGNELA